MPKAFIICGSPASGKTTYGKQLAEEKGAVFIDIDNSTERLVRLALSESGRNQDDRDSEYFKNTYREAIYQTMFDIARENLAWSDAVIVGPFTREIRNISWPEILMAELKSKIEIHYLYCKPDERYERMRKRKSVRDQAKLNDWNSFNKYYGEETPPLFEHIFVDTSSK